MDDSDWKQLPSGRLYNHKFGYGKLDAYALIEAAKSFKLVNQQTWLELPSPVKKRAIPDSTDMKTRKALKNIVLVTEEMVKAAGLLRLEHITATVNIEHQRRGNIVIDLESPNQVKSELATRRNLDDAKTGIENWKFMTVKHWEENPVGNWTLNVYDVDNPESTGFMLNWTLTLFGEQDPNFVGTPIHVSTGIHEDKEHEVSVTTTTTTTDKATQTDNTPSRPTRIKPEGSKATTEATTTTTTTDATTTITTEATTTTTVESTATPKITTTDTTSTDSTTTNDSSSMSDVKSTDTPVNQDDQVITEEETVNKDSGGGKTLTIVYSVVGSVAIFGVASALYFYKKNGWKSPITAPSNDRQIRPDGYEFDVLQPLTELDEEDESEDDEVDRLVRNPNNH
jgi:kexin